MNSEPRHTKVILVGCLAGLMVVGLFVLVVAVWAAQRTPPDYQGFNLHRPWFDGKPWDWMQDMVNQPSIKPQEVGTIERFPADSVPRSGVEPFIPSDAMLNGRLLRDQIPLNPVKPTAASIADGRKLFNIYCAACHGPDGMANTPVVKRGMPAPPIASLFSVLSESHLYNKIHYGGPIMPSYGFQTTRKERWDMVNYMKSPEFGK